MMDDPKSPKDANAINNDHKAQRSGDDNTNPFISFRRYADDQINSLMTSVMGLPSALAREHERWHAARRNDENIAGSGRQEVWVKRWSNDNRDAAVGDEKKEDDPSKWVKIWKPDGQEVKPEVREDEDGGKTWHWSASWSWPPRNNDKPEEAAEDVHRRNLQEARENAEKELQELSNMFKGWFGADEKEDGQHSGRGQNLFDWIWPGDDMSAEKRAGLRRDMEDRIKRFEDEFFNVRDSFSGFGRGPWSHLRVSDEAREGSRILQILDDVHSTGNAFGIPMMRGLGHPLSYFLDYSNPRTRWLLAHPYSPAILEAEAANRGAAAPRYADAFEDLMRAERGLLNRDNGWERTLLPRSYRLLSSVFSRNAGTEEFWQNVEHGGEWYVPEKEGDPPSLNGQRQLQAPSETAELAKKEQEARDHMYERFLGTHTADPKTELDMYERFLGDSSSHHQAPSSSPGSRPSPSEIDVSASPILSTITTTERNVAADGTVTTKVTLKKRFADGREETSETVNTTRGDANASPEANGPNKKTGGWFWSS
ncbi:hypothetical protein MPH_03681 [Macrophomina phaseolina MS6]|uniref:Uncharacterized protein n=1 Tax=Macrophomina phaseolina (strain MS6) TaxID=1126212 RepID=K2R946_MACPH|nr:hypothetical protein MPH_03681 [Macrophomina phaseolina MS6]